MTSELKLSQLSHFNGYSLSKLTYFLWVYISVKNCWVASYNEYYTVRTQWTVLSGSDYCHPQAQLPEQSFDVSSLGNLWESSWNFEWLQKPYELLSSYLCQNVIISTNPAFILSYCYDDVHFKNGTLLLWLKAVFLFLVSYINACPLFLGFAWCTWTKRHKWP